MAFLTSPLNIPPRGETLEVTSLLRAPGLRWVPEASRGWKKPEARVPESRGGCGFVSSGDRIHTLQQTFKRDVTSATPKKNRANKNHCARRRRIKIKTNISH